MRWHDENTDTSLGRRRSAALRAGAAATCIGSLAMVAAQAPASVAASGTAAKLRTACNGGPHVPCRFSTPSGNIRCLWTPSPNNVECELLSTKRAYRLRPTGKAKRVHINLTQRGDTLPTFQDVVFPDSLSCRDTRTTMTCNQDFGLGSFTLSPKGSHSS